MTHQSNFVKNAAIAVLSSSLVALVGGCGEVLVNDDYLVASDLLSVKVWSPLGDGDVNANAYVVAWDDRGTVLHAANVNNQGTATMAVSRATVAVVQVTDAETRKNVTMDIVLGARGGDRLQFGRVQAPSLPGGQTFHVEFAAPSAGNDVTQYTVHTTCGKQTFTPQAPVTGMQRVALQLRDRCAPGKRIDLFVVASIPGGDKYQYLPQVSTSTPIELPERWRALAQVSVALTGLPAGIDKVQVSHRNLIGGNEGYKATGDALLEANTATASLAYPQTAVGGAYLAARLSHKGVITNIVERFAPALAGSHDINLGDLVVPSVDGEATYAERTAQWPQTGTAGADGRVVVFVGLWTEQGVEYHVTCNIYGDATEASQTLPTLPLELAAYDMSQHDSRPFVRVKYFNFSTMTGYDDFRGVAPAIQALPLFGNGILGGRASTLRLSTYISSAPES